MKNTKKKIKKQFEITDDLIGQFLTNAKAVQTGTDVLLSINDRQELDFLDAIVHEKLIPHFICNTHSKHISHSDKHISDYYASSIDGRFVFNSVASNVLGMGYEDVEELTTSQLSEVYQKNKLFNYKMVDYVSENARQRHWGGRPHCEKIVSWRWDNGVMFGNYRDRVLTFLKLTEFPKAEKELTDYCENILKLQAMINILEKDIDILMDSAVFAKLNPITKKVLKSVRHDRLSLDRKAFDLLNQKGHTE